MSRFGEIVTFGMNYSMNDGIRVFCESALKNADKVTVIGTNLQPDVIQYLKERGVFYEEADKLSKWHKIPLTLSPYTLKVLFFYIYAKKYCEADDLYMCDFTDVFIQKRPFELIKEDKCYVSSENHPVGQCQTNATWINLCYNQDLFKLLYNKNILNGGSILGSRENCVYLLKEMVKDCQSIINRIGNYQNIDQASMIKSVYFDLYNYNILKNAEIFNMAYGKTYFPNYKWDGSKVVIGENTPYIVHQYDVDKDLELKIKANF